MRTTSNILLKGLGLLLLSAAVLKGHQLLTEAVANADIWSNRNFLILTVEFELVLGIWLVSGLFKKAAWLATLACFSLFSFITLYKGLTGAASCGCFGSVKVNPWITLFAVDLPAVVASSIFRPDLSFLKERCMSLLRKQESTHSLIMEFLSPFPSLSRFAITAFITITVLGVTVPVLALNEPAKETLRYVILEPETWVGKELPILDYIDIGDELREGNWLILLYHHDCPDCQIAINQLEQLAGDLASNGNFLQVAFIEVPPYGPKLELSNCTLGQLPDTKEWFVTTPVMNLLVNGRVSQVWQEKTPDFDTILQCLLESRDEIKDISFLSSTNQTFDSLGKEVMFNGCIGV